MIDINLLRKERGGNPEKVKESQRKRGGEKAVALVDEILEMDKEWLKTKYAADNVNKDINIVGKKIAPLAKAKQLGSPEALELKKEQESLKAKKVELLATVANMEKELNKKLRLVGNIVHKDVIVSNDEVDNKISYKWWPEGKSEESEKKRQAELVKDGKGSLGLLPHNQILEKIGGYDSPRGVKVAGHRGYFLTGPGVDLNLALIQYGLDFLEKRGYQKMTTPFFMNKDQMAKTAQLEEFDEALYGVVGEEGDSKYLIATSEQPLSAFHADEWFSDPSELPKRYAGFSTCFRKEAGAHGRDTWGIFRIHQFEKIEQFCLTEPEKSWEMFEEMLKTAKDFYESLGLPYHVASIVSGALNNAAAAKYDLEAYFPFQGEYKELVSCSNCTDYQSRELEIRYGIKKPNDPVKRYVHALNCTLTATERTICCILENYQTEEGVVVPEVLRNYMGGKSFFPWKATKKPKGKAVDEQVKDLKV